MGTETRLRRFPRAAGFGAALAMILAAGIASAQQPDSLPTSDQLKRMSLEELLDVQVTLVSKRKEMLTEAPSAIQVITQDDIRRAGVFTLPEALRLASNLQVAQVDARQWAISARGQNNILSNKLLIMIDGRTVYTPLYAGVFWDVQNLLLDNIERIEVISGPGGTLWGANAVNGVINIVTKSAEETQGGLVGAGVGTQMRDVLGARYGGKAGKDIHYRVWGRRLDRNATEFHDGRDGANAWDFTQGGARADWNPSLRDRVSFIGAVYGGNMGQPLPGETTVGGHYEIARWTRDYSEASGFQAQAYFDQSLRDIPDTFEEDLRVLDFDLQHRFAIGARQALVWGAGYRLMLDQVANGRSLAFLPEDKTLHLFNVFVQDQFTLVEDRLRLILGSKLEHNGYSGFEGMPSVRLAWTPDARKTLWGAVSQAVRSPSRIDVEFFVPAPPVPADTLKLTGGPDFQAEKLTASELGFRARFRENMTFSAAAFYNWYDDLRIIEPVGGTEFQYANGAKGEVKGLELSAGIQAFPWWQLRGGYTWLDEGFWLQTGHREYPVPGSQGNDPEHQIGLHSNMDLPAGFQLNGAARYVSALPGPEVPDYFTFDLMAAWQYRGFTVSVVGHDLAAERHPEFGPADARQEIPRSVSGRVAWRF